ncbi:MAG: NAD-glutamate dehydrogenase [Alphaproteobacteria bacterium]
MRNKDLRDEKIEAILTGALSKISQDKTDVFRAFVGELYHNLASYDLDEKDPAYLSEVALQAWDFLQTRASGTPKIHISNQTFEEEGQSFQRTIIEVVHDNLSFLVDSIAAFLNAKGLSLNFVLHPVLRVARDSRGNLLSLCSPREISCTGSIDESFIRYETTEHILPSAFSGVKAQILAILEDIQLAVGDWQEMRAKVQEALGDLERYPASQKDEAFRETLDFLSWLGDHHFTFLGYCAYRFREENSLIQGVDAQAGLGILRAPERQKLQVVFEGVRRKPENIQFLLESQPLIITKTSQRSTIHRIDFMDCIGVKQFDAKGHVVGFHQFLGLFTSSAYNQSARDIPLLRYKISQVLKQTGLAPNWHDGKALIHVLETLPREELLQSSVPELYELSFSVLQLQERQRLSFFMRPDQFGRYLSCFIYIPRERYGATLRKKMGEMLEKIFQGKISSWNIHLGDLAFARLHYIISLPAEFEIAAYDTQAIEKQLFQQLFTWGDFFKKSVKKRYGDEAGEGLFNQYGEAFSRAYQDQFDAEEAMRDIEFIEAALQQDSLQVSLKQIEASSGATLQIKLYNPHSIIFLSNILPVFEQMGLKVTTEIPFKVLLQGRQEPFWIHSLEVFPLLSGRVPSAAEQALFLEAFLKIWHQEAENDGFNRLVLEAGLTWRECQILRTYSRYLKQLNTPFSQAYIEQVLAKEPDIVRELVAFFCLRFSPDVEGDRESACLEKQAALEKLLDGVTNSDEDRILRRFLNLITATVRTNFYQTDATGAVKPYLSLKLHSQRVDESPRPVPLYEIFVYAAQFEAIHLRGGKVARGGIRWSDRPEDYRTELHDLWKTQTVKNAVIVPVGSKGAFVVKKTDAPTREAWLEEGIQCYKRFMRALLELTDNWVKGKLVSPEKTVRYDDEDPYLVVAADKGTATFSDIANQISHEFNFWLGDAFASGGSVGYDHKKMGITARGAWKSVEHHFKALGVNVSKDPVTVVGVGDMSGDVFGNGMLLSKSLKLVAAFNHQHIFLDPTPHPLKSYEERKRLFELPRSTWMEYQPNLISEGGGVFERSAKRISLSPEVKAMLQVKEDSLTPQELIRCLLKIQVDLLWFGGIGTFVKASHENNAEVGDKANDACRVDGRDIQAKVIAEGANLGLTQGGRIEYALKGGNLNTDALDNSAGVDCSDHEVNIKILFRPLLEQQTLPLEARNQLLESMTDEVARLVLQDNYWQNQAVSLAHAHAPYLLEEHRFLIQDLERLQGLDRSVENLPDEAELSRRQSLQMGLTKPELCVLLAYAKIYLYQEVLYSDVVDDPALVPMLVQYFPEILASKFQEAILQHALRREIIATHVSNLIVNTTGPTFVFEIARLTGQPIPRILKAILIVRHILQLESVEDTLEQLPLNLTLHQQIMWEVNRAVKVSTNWFLGNEKLDSKIEAIITPYQKQFKTLSEVLLNILPESHRQKLDARAEQLASSGLPRAFAQQLILLHLFSLSGDIVQVASKLTLPVQDVAWVYHTVGESLGLRWLWETAYAFPAETYWLRTAFRSIREEVQAAHRSFVSNILAFAEKGRSVEQAIEAWEQAYHEPHQRYQIFLKQMMANTVIDLGSLVILNQKLRQLEAQTRPL